MTTVSVAVVAADITRNGGSVGAPVERKVLRKRPCPTGFQTREGESAMSEVTTRQQRTTRDLVVGGLIAVLGVVILAHAAVATTLSVVFVGWLLFAAGSVTLVAALFLIGKAGFWSGALGGGLLTVVGILFLRNTSAAAVTLTLVVGAMFLASGVGRLVAAAQEREARVPLLVSGAVSTVLGLMVVFNLTTASYALLGLIVGIQTLCEGIAIMLVGRGGLAADEG